MENSTYTGTNKIKEREKELISSEKSFIYKIIEKCTPDKLVKGSTNTYNLENGTGVQLNRDQDGRVSRVFIFRDGITIDAGHFSNEYARYKKIPDESGDKRLFDISYVIRIKS